MCEMDDSISFISPPPHLLQLYMVIKMLSPTSDGREPLGCIQKGGLVRGTRLVKTTLNAWRGKGNEKLSFAWIIVSLV